MIIKITSYDVHVRRSYFNRQNSQLFNQRIPREIQYYRVFFFFLIPPQSRRSYVFTRVVHSQSLINFFKDQLNLPWVRRSQYSMEMFLWAPSLIFNFPVDIII
jgi:hypothetical protein